MIRSRLPSLLTWTAVSLCLLGLAGCGPSRSSVKGTLVLPASVQLKDSDSVVVMFVAADPSTGVGSGPGAFDAKTKTFEATSSAGKGLPPGKYKISVQINPYPGDPDQARVAALTDLSMRYSSDATKLEYTVTDAPTQNVTVDLEKGTVTAATPAK